MISRLNKEGFVSIFRDWEETFRSFIVSLYAVKSDGEWVPRYGSIVFSPMFEKNDVPDIHVQTENVLGCRLTCIMDDGDANKFIYSLDQGLLDIELGEESIEIKLKERVSFFYHPDHHPDFPGTEKVPTLQIMKDHQFNSIDNIFLDSELRASSTPYDGIDDLLLEIGIHPDRKNESRIFFDLVLRAPVLIDDMAKIEENNVCINLKASSSLNEDEFNIAFKVVRKNKPPERFKVNSGEVNWRLENGWKFSSVIYKTGSPLAVQVFLTYKNEAILRWWVTDPNKSLNYRSAVHKEFDNNFEKLNKLLFPSRNVSRDLEKGFSQLLWAHGFSVAHYGEKESAQDAPDLIAETQSGKMIVIECTIAISDVDKKLSKLTQRAQKVKESLDRSYRQDMVILPLLATNMSQQDLEPYMEQASKYSAAIITNEHINSLLDRLELPLQADNLFDEFSHLVPQRNNEALPFFDA